MVLNCKFEFGLLLVELRVSGNSIFGHNKKDCGFHNGIKFSGITFLQIGCNFVSVKHC